MAEDRTALSIPMVKKTRSPPFYRRTAPAPRIHAQCVGKPGAAPPCRVVPSLSPLSVGHVSPREQISSILGMKTSSISSGGNFMRVFKSQTREVDNQLLLSRSARVGPDRRSMFATYRVRHSEQPSRMGP